MKHFVLIAALLFSLSLTACGGGKGNPFYKRQLNAGKPVCEEVEFVLFKMRGGINTPVGEEYPAKAENVRWGAAGIMFFPLWLSLNLIETATGTGEIALPSTYGKRGRIKDRLIKEQDCDF
ncbi:MAG: hypothetical protein V6Z81_08475 [Parvularculales bacterium]